MPGYECDRFVGLSAADIQELSCSICLNIFRDPVVSQCCRQTFYRDCITDWLQENTVCPYDRKTLNVNELHMPPRVFEAMFGKLEIKCQFSDNGCPSVVPLDQLSQHVDSCPYDASKCGKCFCEQTSGHDCIQALLALNRTTNNEIKTLNLKLESYMTRVLYAVNIPQPSTSAPVSIESILTTARSERFNAVIVGCDMKDDIRHKVLVIVAEELMNDIQLGKSTNWTENLVAIGTVYLITKREYPGLSPTHIQELSCSICLNIIRDPVVTPCCHQTFCRDCLIEWLKENTVCPYDRKTLNANELYKPRRVFEDILGKLKIKCKFSDNGCPSVVPLDQLPQHVNSCPYNAPKCESDYECDRFVGLSAADIQELSCSICLNIFRDPVVSQCCRQTFCRDCITDWLKGNTVCPYDRKKLTVNELHKPSRAFEAMFGKLEIKCQFSDNGCPSVVPLDQLPQHVKSCPYHASKVYTKSKTTRVFEAILGKFKIKCKFSDNGCPSVAPLDHLSQHVDSCPYDASKCGKCFCKQTSGHDCIQALLALNRTTNNEIKTLNKKLESYMPRVSYAVNIPQPRTSGPVSINCIVTINNDSIGYWNCICDYKEVVASYVTYNKGFWIKCKIGQLIFDIYKDYQQK
ncbi:unnamed protein product [Oppiella nova]|uniref:RING-type domain-containing protein n=1 Tax=Oppiella nova TaxID=334625 RepID=A0A7R9LTW6_9ACAR|nr:unnamed protein product [Oppiella nova]CAG2166305.1 unnamed protein product [Oppiella nova]